MLRRQETDLEVGHVQTVWHTDSVHLPFIILDVKNKSAGARDFQPLRDSIHLLLGLGWLQVFKYAASNAMHLEAQLSTLIRKESVSNRTMVGSAHWSTVASKAQHRVLR